MPYMGIVEGGLTWRSTLNYAAVYGLWGAGIGFVVGLLIGEWIAEFIRKSRRKGRD
jgi:hypothetical protein